MSQRPREDGVGVDGNKKPLHQRFSIGQAPMLRRPDEETAEDSGWINLTYEDEIDDDFDNRPLSQLSEKEVERRLEELES